MEVQSQEGEIALWMLIILVAMVLMALAIIVIAGTAFRKAIKQEEEKHDLKLAYQQQLLKSSLAVQEKERARIAADLHDELASRLSVARLTLQFPEAIQKQREKTPIALIDEVIDTVRGISHDLNPPLLEKHGFIAALTDFLQPLQQHYNLSLHATRIEGERFALEKERQLFRIVQEAVHNAMKHAQFTHLTVIVRISTKCVSVSVTDNGVGFSVKKVKTGAGIQSMESRVQVIEGKWKIKSHPRKGTSILIFTQLKKRTND